MVALKNLQWILKWPFQHRPVESPHNFKSPRMNPRSISTRLSRATTSGSKSPCNGFVFITWEHLVQQFSCNFPMLNQTWWVRGLGHRLDATRCVPLYTCGTLPGWKAALASGHLWDLFLFMMNSRLPDPQKWLLKMCERRWQRIQPPLTSPLWRQFPSALSNKSIHPKKVVFSGKRDNLKPSLFPITTTDFNRKLHHSRSEMNRSVKQQNNPLLPTGTEAQQLNCTLVSLPLSS